MNKEIYIALCEHLTKQVPELKFIDWDSGQLNIVAERPPIDYPACLIDINYTSCRDLTDREQLIAANIVLKLIFRPNGDTSNITPKNIKQKALECFDVIENVQDALQGCELGGLVSAISRATAIKSIRRDRLQVYTITYNTTWQEIYSINSSSRKDKCLSGI